MKTEKKGCFLHVNNEDVSIIIVQTSKKDAKWYRSLSKLCQSINTCIDTPKFSQLTEASIRPIFPLFKCY